MCMRKTTDTFEMKTEEDIGNMTTDLFWGELIREIMIIGGMTEGITSEMTPMREGDLMTEEMTIMMIETEDLLQEGIIMIGVVATDFLFSLR